MERLTSIIVASPPLIISTVCFLLASIEAGVELHRSSAAINTSTPNGNPFRAADHGHDELTTRSGASSIMRGRGGFNSHRRDDSPELKDEVLKSGMHASPKVLRFMVSSPTLFFQRIASLILNAA